MTMTKASLVQIVCEKTRFAFRETAEFIDHVFEIMVETLERGEKIKISGFASFTVREKRARIGRNPRPAKIYGFPAAGS